MACGGHTSYHVPGDITLRRGNLKTVDSPPFLIGHLLEYPKEDSKPAHICCYHYYNLPSHHSLLCDQSVQLLLLLLLAKYSNSITNPILFSPVIVFFFLLLYYTSTTSNSGLLYWLVLSTSFWLRSSVLMLPGIYTHLLVYFFGHRLKLNCIFHELS